MPHDTGDNGDFHDTNEPLTTSREGSRASAAAPAHAINHEGMPRHTHSRHHDAVAGHSQSVHEDRVADHSHLTGQAHADHPEPADQIRAVEQHHQGHQHQHTAKDKLSLNCCGLCIAFAIAKAPVAALSHTMSTVRFSFESAIITDRPVDLDPGIPKPTS